jgi:iron(III) transport system substrate-binding protein
MRVSALTAVWLSLLLTSCDSGPLPPAIVVYAVGNDEAALLERLTEFTADTRIPITMVFSKNSKNADLVINNSGSPPADVLITNNVADIWRAADKGALRPLDMDAIEGSDPLLTDPDGFWTAVAMRWNVIGALKKEPNRPLVADYDALASEELRGQVCLSSSSLSVNRSLIAMLINDRGVKNAERLVRAWIRNLATAPFSSEAQLVEGIRDGTCEYGILSSPPHLDGLIYFVPEQRYMDIDGIGVARHARQPESAQKLVEWLVREKQPRITGEYDVQPVRIAGWRDEEAILLAERAGYQ